MEQARPAWGEDGDSGPKWGVRALVGRRVPSHTAAQHSGPPPNGRCKAFLLGEGAIGLGSENPSWVRRVWVGAVEGDGEHTRELIKEVN